MTTRTPTETAHIWLDERGRAWIDDTRVKVIQVVRMWLSFVGLMPFTFFLIVSPWLCSDL